MKTKSLSQDVIDRLLIAKDFLERIYSLPNANPDRYTIAQHILTAHDAAELALAGIARHVDKLPPSPKTYLMDYFSSIRETHPNEEVPGKEYFSQLNQVRIGIKHNGIFPDPKQWFRVGENTKNYVLIWCNKYLNLSFKDIDESDMISDAQVKEQYDIAKKVFIEGDHKGVLENIAKALYLLFQSNNALRNLRVGTPHAEDALKLSAFGVHANEFLALQEFLPRTYQGIDGKITTEWKQDEYGHAANWRCDSSEFCLKTFVSVALRIQDAQWIPGAIEFNIVYEHEITALKDNVKIVEVRSNEPNEPKYKHVARTLNKGESIRGYVSRKDNPLIALLSGKEYKPVLHFVRYQEPMIIGDIEADKISITCVPKDNELIREYFPNLPEMKYE
jgi:hypothetical protein